MAFIPKSPAELEQEEQERQLKLSGATAAPTSSAAPAPATPKEPKPQGPTNASGRFINFQQYFAPNAAQAATMGNQLAQPIDTEGKKIQSETAGTKATQAASIAAGTAQGPREGDQILSLDNPNQPGFQWIEKSVQYTPEQQLSGALTRDKAAANAEKGYSGPAADDINRAYDPYQDRARKVSEQADLTKDTSGLQTLLKEKAAGPYTAGQSRLDAALAGKASGDKFHELRQRFGGDLLGKEISDARISTLEAADAAKKTSDANQAAWKQLVTNFDDVEQATEDKRVEDVAKADTEEWKSLIAQAAKQSGYGPEDTAELSREGRPPATFQEFWALTPWRIGDLLNPWPARAYERMADSEKKQMLKILVTNPGKLFDYMNTMVTKYILNNGKVTVVGQRE